MWLSFGCTVRFTMDFCLFLYVLTSFCLNYCADGWLGFMIGTELWYPLWEEDMIQSTVNSIAGMVGDNARLEKNKAVLVSTGGASGSSGGCVNANSFIAPVAAPVTAVYTAPTNAAPTVIDPEVAWNMINGSNLTFATDASKLAELFNELGLSECADMYELNREQIDSLAALLKPIPKKKFLKVFQSVV